MSVPSRVISSATIAIRIRYARIRSARMCAIVSPDFDASTNSIVLRWMNVRPARICATRTLTALTRLVRTVVGVVAATKATALTANVSLPVRSVVYHLYFCLSIVFNSNLYAKVFERCSVLGTEFLHMPHGLHRRIVRTGSRRMCNWLALVQFVGVLCKYAGLVLLQMQTGLRDTQSRMSWH